MESLLLYFVLPIALSWFLFALGGGISTLLRLRFDHETAAHTYLALGVSLFAGLSTGLNYFLPFSKFVPVIALLSAVSGAFFLLQQRNRTALATWSTLTYGSLSALPALLLSMWTYIRWTPDGVTTATASADLISFSSTAEYLYTHSQRSVDRLADINLGQSWLLSHKEFHFPFGDASFSNLGRFILGVDTNTGVQIAVALAIVVVSFAIYDLLCICGLGGRRAAVGAALISSLPILVENAVAHSLASHLGLALFVCWILILVSVSKAPNLYQPVTGLSLTSTALVAVYPQYLLLAVPVVLTFLFLRRVRLWAVMLFTLFTGIAAAPSLVQAFLFLTSTSTADAANQFWNPFFSRQIDEALSRFFGLSPVFTSNGTNMVELISIALLVTAVCLCLIRAKKDLTAIRFLPAVLSCLVVVSSLVIVFDAPYSEFRLLRMVIPLVWILVVIVVLGRATGLLSVVLVLVVAFNSIHYVGTSDYVSRDAVSDRTIDSNYRELNSWFNEIEIEDDDQVLFVSDDFFTSHFGLLELRDNANLTMPILLGTYYRLNEVKKWNGRVPRYLLLDRYSNSFVDREAVVKENDRFLLVDTSQSSVAGLFRTPGTDLWAGHRHLTSSKVSVLTLERPFWMFAVSTSGSLNLRLSCEDSKSGTVIINALNQFHDRIRRTPVAIQDDISIDLAVPADVRWMLLHLEPLWGDLDSCILVLNEKTQVLK